MRTLLALVITHKKRTTHDNIKTGTKHIVPVMRVYLVHVRLTNHPTSKNQLHNAEPMHIDGMRCLAIFAFLDIRSAVTPAH